MVARVKAGELFATLCEEWLENQGLQVYVLGCSPFILKLLSRDSSNRGYENPC